MYSIVTDYIVNISGLRFNIISYQSPEGEVDLTEFITGYDDWESYTSAIAKTGVFADHVAVIGMAHMLQSDILIIPSSPASGPDDFIWITGLPNYSESPILLGHSWENHYQSLEPIGR